MIVPLLVLIAVLSVALAVLASRLRRWHAAALRVDARLAEANAHLGRAASAARAALARASEGPAAHASLLEPRSETTPRPSRRARRAPALPDRP